MIGWTILITTFLTIPFAIEIGLLMSCADTNTEYALLSPARMKTHSTMNWFGCWACYILLGIISPLMFIIKSIYNLFHI